MRQIVSLHADLPHTRLQVVRADERNEENYWACAKIEHSRSTHKILYKTQKTRRKDYRKGQPYEREGSPQLGADNYETGGGG